MGMMLLRQERQYYGCRPLMETAGSRRWLMRANLAISHDATAPSTSIPKQTDDETLPIHDAVLHVVFAEAGMCSSHWSSEQTGPSAITAAEFTPHRCR
jgi:hypothetical protein